MKKLVLASGSPGKIREFAQMLTSLEIEIVPQSTLGIPDAEEPHVTFVENALAKARHASRLSRMAAFADDSGICAAALNGEPGVHSARYSVAADSANVSPTREAQDARNNQKLLQALEQYDDRRVHYYCVIVLVRRADDPEPVIAEGVWRGEVIASPRGTNGFGYDPHFYVPSLGCTAAELDADTKNGVSHRGQALRALLSRLQTIER